MFQCISFSLSGIKEDFTKQKSVEATTRSEARYPVRPPKKAFLSQLRVFEKKHFSTDSGVGGSSKSPFHR